MNLLYYKFKAFGTLMICLCLFLGQLKVTGQNKLIIDSLIEKINSASPGSDVENHILLSLEYADNNPIQALEYIDRALSLALKNGDSLHIVEAGRIKGQLLKRNNRFDEVFPVLLNVLPIAKRNNFTDDYKRILNILAMSYTLNANYSEALKFNFESLILREKEGDGDAIVIALNNIGFVYYKLNDHNTALEYYIRAFNLKRQIKGNEKEMGRLLINMGLCYNQLKQYDVALELINQAFVKCDGQCDGLLLMEGKFAVGISLRGLGKPEDAKDCFIESHAIAKELNDVRFQIDNLIYLGRVYYETRQITAAVLVLDEAEKLASSSNFNQLLLETYGEFIRVHKSSGGLEAATDYQDKYIHLNEAIYEAQLSRIAYVQEEYVQRENVQMIAAQGKILQVKELMLEKQRLVNILIAIVATLFCILLVILLFINLQKQRINKLLDDKVRERTTTLEANLFLARKIQHEQAHFLTRTHQELLSSILTINGLLNLIGLEASNPFQLREILVRLESTTDKLKLIMERVARNKPNIH